MTTNEHNVPIDAAKRLMNNLELRAKEYETTVPTDYQVGLVLKALADHTAIMQALKYRPDPTSPWVDATSIGRWLHDTGDVLLEAGS
ncbi:hypothetical protein HAV21_03285 [Paenarthrobacter sp. MSM-2-10-13]|uniref:hypothetical protein n=1 Tax=Paenarthrobacter sp. MSM-2-10-13 TaxID=2717318 RepID=UPI0014232653|nr:hypothetical protein [Paenarthrobacter sp. MSM-2-10-13]NHW45921.1 hypothetical protein [Paenarthrobacter sp. MSM-2-10-13]